MLSGTIILTRAGDMDIVTYRNDVGGGAWSAILTVPPGALSQCREPWQIIPYTKPISKHTVHDLLTLVDVETERGYMKRTIYVLPPRSKSKRSDQSVLAAHGWKRTRKHVFPGVTSAVWEKSVYSVEAAQHLFDIHRWQTIIEPSSPSHAKAL